MPLLLPALYIYEEKTRNHSVADYNPPLLPPNSTYKAVAGQVAKSGYRPDLREAAVARVSPKAHVLVISNPVNSTVPIVAAVFEKAGVFDPKRIFGVTTLDGGRSSRFLGGIAGADPRDLASTHLLRGDASMALYTMGAQPTSHGSAAAQAPQLLRNAEVYYRNAAKLSRDTAERNAAAFRSHVAATLLRRGEGGEGDEQRLSGAQFSAVCSHHGCMAN